MSEEDRCPTCGASTTSPLTLRNVPGYPVCKDCGAVTSLRKEGAPTAQDHEDLTAIHLAAEARDVTTMVLLMHRYYSEVERADRTPRAILYFHLGLMMGVALNAAEQGATDGPVH